MVMGAPFLGNAWRMHSVRMMSLSHLRATTNNSREILTAFESIQ